MGAVAFADCIGPVRIPLFAGIENDWSFPAFIRK